MKLILLLTTVLLSSPLASANVLFEGWFEIFVGAKKIGYLVERYEFENSKFKGVYYLKTNIDGRSVTESLKAFANADLTPQNYAYTSKSGEEVKIVDAKFKGETMNLSVSDGKSEKKETKKIKKGTFLSTFLLYLIMSQKEGGLKTGKKYSYSAIAEEEGTAYVGEALVSSADKVKGKDAFKILNKFKIGAKDGKTNSSLEERFFTWVSPKGEILLTRSPEKNIEVRFAEGQKAAVGDMSVNGQDLKLLFGKRLPAEKDSDEKAKPAPSQTPPPQGPSSQAPASEGLPAQKAIDVKTLPPKKASGTEE